jgi:serine/threonine-protein kinase
VEKAVRTALAKVPADRFATAGEFAAMLANDTTDRHAPQVQGIGGWRVAAAVGALVMLAAAAATWKVTRDSTPPARAARMSITIPEQYTIGAVPFSTIALSADGSAIVFPGAGERTTQLYLRRLDDLTTVPLAGSEEAIFPLFSPNGDWVAFVKAQFVYRLPTAGGGSPVRLNLPPATAGIWAKEDEFLITGRQGELSWAREDGSTRLIARIDTARHESALLPVQLLPDGRILVIATRQGFVGPLWIIDPDDGSREAVVSTDVGMASYADGMMAWGDRQGTVRARQWNLRRGGEGIAEVTVANNVRFPPGIPPQLAFSATGDLVYVPAQRAQLVLVRRDGSEQTISGEPRNFHNPRVSPDGSTIAVDVSEATRDVWLLHLADRTMTRATFVEDGHDPVWMPDGRSLLYGHARGATTGINRSPIGERSTIDSIVHAGGQLTAHAVSRDGSTIFAVQLPVDGSQMDIVRVSLDGEPKAEPFLASSDNESHPALSPDGSVLAYVTEETGRTEVYVRRLMGTGARVLVSTEGGSEPVWSRDGRELYYRNTTANTLVAARIEMSPQLRVAGRQTLFSVRQYEPATPHANYDVTPDGRFVFVKTAVFRELIYLQNWPALARGRR